MLAPFVMGHAALEPDRRPGRHRPQIIDLHVPRHCPHAAYPDRLAHHFIQQRSDNAAMDVAYRAFKCIRHCRKTHDRVIFGKEEFEMQSYGVGLAAAETAVLRGVGHRGQVFAGCGSFFTHSWAPARTFANISRSTLPPVSTIPMRLPLRVSFSLSAPASAAAPAPSARLCVSS